MADRKPTRLALPSPSMGEGQGGGGCLRPLPLAPPPPRSSPIKGEDEASGGLSLRSLLRPLVLLLFALLLPPLPASGEPPRRVVSLNVCVDQLVLLLADRGQIAALSYAAANPAQSWLAPLAEGIPLTYGRAEEVLPLAPDLVLAGAYTARAGVAILRDLGYRVVDVPDAMTLDDIRAAIRQVAGLLGHPARGEALIAEFDARLAAAAPRDARRPRVAFLSLGLYTNGAGTLVDAVLGAAGLENAALGWGIDFIGPVALETLVLDPPEAFVMGLESGSDPSLSAEVLDHPAIRALVRTRPRIEVPGRAWVCGAPVLAEVVEQLAALRRRLLEPGS